ncbi:MAG: radical SAM protein [Bacteroidales bacterium]|nr:radical SAM protein [Bacteroidales bacterium]
MLPHNFENTPLPVTEIFQSISGEGISSGNVVVFVRLAGCNLRCTWCDTKYSLEEKAPGTVLLLPGEILHQVKSFGINEVICTGGEPLEEDKPKRALPLYLAANGVKVRIETSGASPLYTLEEFNAFAGAEPNIQYCMDVKCPASKMVYKNNLKNIALLRQGDELKFVVQDQTDLNFSFDVIEAYKFHLSEKKIAINFSPVFGAIKPVEIVNFLKEKANYSCENSLWVRLSLQIHKYIWPPHKRGV